MSELLCNMLQEVLGQIFSDWDIPSNCITIHFQMFFVITFDKMKKKMRIDMEIKTKKVQSQNFMHPVLPTAKDVFCSFCYQNEKK